MFSNLRFGRHRFLHDEGIVSPIIVFKGHASGGANNTANPTIITVSPPIDIAIGDAIVVGTSEQANLLSAVSAGDNLGNPYVVHGTGQVNTTIAHKVFRSVATVAGLLTSVSIVTTASSNDFSAKLAVFGGPFGPVDAAPADKNEFTRPLTGNPTGVLSQALELVVSVLSAASQIDPATVSAPFSMAGDIATGGLRRTVISYYDATSTISIIPEFSGGANVDSVISVMSFPRL